MEVRAPLRTNLRLVKFYKRFRRRHPLVNLAESRRLKEGRDKLLSISQSFVQCLYDLRQSIPRPTSSLAVIKMDETPLTLSGEHDGSQRSLGRRAEPNMLSA